MLENLFEDDAGGEEGKWDFRRQFISNVGLK